MTDFRSPVGPAERTLMAIVQAQRLPVVGPLFRMVAKWKGVQIPPNTFTRRPHLAHVGTVVVHERAKLAPTVTLFHNVTFGRSDPWNPPKPTFEGFVVEDHVLIGAGVSVLAHDGRLTIREGTIVGANSVLTQSTGPWEIWAGAPARKVGERARVN